MSERDAVLSKALTALHSYRAWMDKQSTSVLATAISTKVSFTNGDTHVVSSAAHPAASLRKKGSKMAKRKNARIQPFHSTGTTYTLEDDDTHLALSPPLEHTTPPTLSPPLAHDASTTPPTLSPPPVHEKTQSVFSPPRAQAWSTPNKEQKLPLQKVHSSPQGEEPVEREELTVDSSISSMASDASDARDEKGASCSSLDPGRSEVPSREARNDCNEEALWLASGTKVVCVSPAPTHLRTDTTVTRLSKLGIISDSVDSATTSKSSVDYGMYRRIIASNKDAGGNDLLQEVSDSTKRLVSSLKASEGDIGGDGGGEDIKHIGGVRHEAGVFSDGEGDREGDGEGGDGEGGATDASQRGKQVGNKQDIDPAMQLLVMAAPSTRGPAMMVTLPEKSPASSDGFTLPCYDRSSVLKMSTHSQKQSNSGNQDGGTLDPSALITQDALCGTKLSSKRDRAPPSYTMHAPGVGVAASSPSCPLYGVVQPTDKEFIKVSVKPLTCKSVVLTPNKPADRMINEPVVKATSRSSVENDVSFPLKPSSVQDGCSSPSDMEEEDLTPSSALSRIPAGPGPLHLLARTGNLRRLQAAIEEGHDVNAQDHEGKTPLMYCITGAGVHLSCADLLLKEGANLDHQSSDGSTALHVAAFAGALSLIELMLLNGANPDIKDLEGRLPLHWATKQRSPKCIATLLKNSNFDVNKGDDSGMTALMWACHFDNVPVVSYLLENGADLEEKDKDGLTAMHWAIHKNSVQCLQLLLKPDMTYFKNHNGLTVMHKAALEGSMVACEHILTMRGDAFHDTDKKGHTPLHFAAASSKVDVCAFLLDRGADASQRDFSGHTPLDYAYIKKLDYVVALFMCHEASVADFARVSRSAVSASYTSLEQSESVINTDETNRSLSATLFKTLAEGSHPAIGFLGKYSNNGKGPLHHYYFWLDVQAKQICWSRYSNMRAPEVAQVQSVYGGASDIVKMRLDYSPLDINKYSFWVVTTGGVLDLTAYSEEQYVSWLTHINDIAHDKRVDLLGLLSSPQTTRPGTATGFGKRLAWSDGASGGVLHNDSISSEDGT